MRLSLLGATFALLLVGCGGSRPASQSTPGDASSDPVVARIGDSTITASAVRRAYEQSVPLSDSAAADFQASGRDFLTRYVNYRLKVRAARAAGYDTMTSVRREIGSYRRTVARPALLRKHVYGPLTRTLYERRQTEVDVSHILLRVGPDAAPEDTLEAYRRMQSIADSARRGVPFRALAYRNSDDPSARREGQPGYQGHLDYVRAGEVVAPFERRMYEVAPDSVSDVFRTRFGYHLLKVHDRRPAQQPVRLAHIMARPRGDTAAARRLLDSLRTALQRGETSFAAAAQEFSDDRRTASKGGDLGQVTNPQSLPSAFRETLPRLDSVGAVSDVVRSRFGYHLIKLTGRERPRSYEAAYEDLKQQIQDRPRVDRRKTAYARTVRRRQGTSIDTTRLLNALPSATVDSSSRALLPFTDRAGADTLRIAALGDSTYTLSQLARHVLQMDGGARSSIGDVLQSFLDAKALRYAETRLVRRDSSLDATMQEYRNGVLLYHFMQDSVWTAAAQDTTGLRRYYRQHANRYRFSERIRTLVLRAPADSLLSPYRRTDTARAPSALVRRARADSLVDVDTLMVTDQTPPPYRRVQSVQDGAVVGPLSHEGRSLLLVRDARLPPRRKSFDEARSSVMTDYQEYYEERVLDRLRRRFDVETYPRRLRRAGPPASLPPGSSS